MAYDDLLWVFDALIQKFFEVAALSKQLYSLRGSG